MKKNVFPVIASALLIVAIVSCNKKTDYYSASDFSKVAKTDVHFHYNTPDTRYLQFADSLNMKIVTPNVDASEPIDKQFLIAESLKKQFPEQIAFLGTFSVDSFNHPGFAEKTIEQIDRCMNAGASGIKIWKNIGMVLKDTAENFVFSNDLRFSPIFEHMAKNGITVMAHLGEPRNCWLPENEMTLDNDRRYYKNHSEYHMYLHPEYPSYEDQLIARDSLLTMYPNLYLVGAHLGSMEWNIDEIAKRLDLYPNFDVDMSARIGHLQLQAAANYEKVRNFMIRYQDRIMYGTDITLRESGNNYRSVCKGLENRWYEHWLFLATDSLLSLKDPDGLKVKGLHLPSEVIDKIYSQNAQVFFKK